jgi:hypothetical protein
MGKIRNLLRKLRRSKSGNATMLLALGTPMLIGGTGLAVDTAQWYLWKRELQFAVDQSAIAAAWARAESPTGNTYIVRGEQEYENNLSLVKDFDSGPTITLEDYQGGTDNSVQVVATATKMLPFSSFLTNESATVSALAVTIFEPGGVYNPCLLALDPTAPEALFLNGTVNVTASCGVGAISNDPTAVTKVGESGNVDVNFVITGGEIVDEHGHFDEETQVENARDISDPYDDLVPPDNNTPRTLSCSKDGVDSYTADESIVVETVYAYFQGKNRNSLTSINWPDAKSTETMRTFADDKEFGTPPVNSIDVGDTVYTEIDGAGNDRIYEASTTTTTKTYTDINAPSNGNGIALPGTYAGFNVRCDTVMASGIYVIDGGVFKVNADTSLVGSGVMFVLKNGASINIAGSAKIALSAMNEAQMLAAGIPAADVDALLGMLIFEDPDSPGSDESQITGSSSAVFDGIIYLPNSPLKIAGTPKGNSQCMVIATKTLQFAGTTDVSSLCPTGATPKGTALKTSDRVLLVG